MVRGLVSAWCGDSRKEKTRLRERGVTPSLRDGNGFRVCMLSRQTVCAVNTFFLRKFICERVCIWDFLTVVCDRKPGSTPSQCNQQVCPPWQACRVEMSSVYFLSLFLLFYLSVSLSLSARGADLEKTIHESNLPWRADVMCSIYISPPLKTLDEPLNNSYRAVSFILFCINSNAVS